MNTGNKQAIIARRVTRPGKAPLDINGNMLGDMGAKKEQAILLLEGEENPKPSEFELFTYFRPGEVIDGQPSIKEDLTDCPIPVGHITLSESEIILTDDNLSATVTLDSSHAWTLTNVPSDLTVSPIGGNGGIHTITITSRRQGPDVVLIFKNNELNETASLKVTDNAKPDYIKYPLEQRWIEVDPAYDTGGAGYNILSKNWDTAGLPGTGDLGGYNRGTYYTRRVGEYEWTLENWKMVLNPTRNYKDYIVDQPILDASNVSMTEADSARKNGCYFYNGAEVWNLITSGLGVFNVEDKDASGKNLFIKSLTMGNWDVDADGKVFTNPQAVSFWFHPQSNRILTIHRKAATSKFAAYRMYTGPFEGNQVTDKVENDSDVDTFTYRTYTVQLAILVVVSNDGTSVDDLQKIIQIENGTTFTGWEAPKDILKLTGWSIPRKEDFLQLFGMAGEDLSVNNLFRELFVSPTDEVPWIDTWEVSGTSQDTVGSRLVPCGHKLNNNLQGSVGGHYTPGIIHNFGSRAAFGTYSSPNQGYTSPTVWISLHPLPVAKNPDGSVKSYSRVTFDFMNNTVPASIQYWQRHARFCRPLTDEELGYKLWRDDANDRILVTALNQPQPAGTTELAKGLLRGMAVRWLNAAKTKVAVPLSRLLAEIEKTRNDGEHQWYGWY
ncbi:MAG: hypothetical protein E6772_07690 [Dysgonomonas sp.]|nr:hypothetical protein [Dysgonomonas sp.]